MIRISHKGPIFGRVDDIGAGGKVVQSTFFGPDLEPIEPEQPCKHDGPRGLNLNLFTENFDLMCFLCNATIAESYQKRG